MYQDIYDEVDSEMSDSNVGARKSRNIRDNLFVLYSVIGDALDRRPDMDIHLYDLAKCFDAMWWEETCNDMWDKGIRDDKFALISAMNEQCNVSIKTPVGQTDRFNLEKIEMQGTVLGPLKYAIQMDTIGIDAYTSEYGLFSYKKMISVPPMGMIDDVVGMSLCGADSIMSNAIVNSKVEFKRLQFGPSKCFQIHVGANKKKCCTLKVHQYQMKPVEHEVYLGDTVSADLSNNRNIEKRCNQSIGTISEIMIILKQISKGYFYFNIGLIMRESILLSKLLLNSEAWTNITKQQVLSLEKSDRAYLIRFVNGHSRINEEILHGELCTTPIRYLLMQKRLMYLWHILQ